MQSVESDRTGFAKRNHESPYLCVNSYDMILDLTSEKYYVDLFSLRILSLLLCRGDVKDKATYLFDLVTQKSSVSANKNDEKKSFVSSENPKNKKNKPKPLEIKIEYANQRL